MMKLDIQRFAISKSTTFKETGISIENNNSDLTITIYFSANNDVTYFEGATLRCTCNGETKSATVSHSKGGSVTKSFTFSNIAHNTDGTKKVTWSWSCATGTSTLGTVSASGTKTLTTIPRTSSVTVGDTFIGANANIKITKKSSSFVTTIAYKFSGQSNFTNIVSKTSASSYSWTVPESVYAMIPNAKKLQCTIRAYTYSSASATTYIGYKDDTFYALTSEAVCEPVITETSIVDSKDLTSLTGSNTRFIRYVSRPTMSWVATRQKSSTIKTQKINGTVATSPFTVNSWSDNYELVVTDSRGYSNEYNYEMDVVPYIVPTINFAVKKQSPTSSKVFITLKGNYYNGYFDDNNNNLNTVSVETRYKKTTDKDDKWTNITLEPNIDGNGEITLNDFDLGEICDYKYTWNFEVIIKDSIYNATTEELTKKTATILNKGIPNHNWYEDHEGNNVFNVNGDLKINGLTVPEPNIITLNKGTETAMSTTLNYYNIGFGNVVYQKGTKLFLSTTNNLETTPASVYCVKIGKNVKAVKANVNLQFNNNNTTSDMYFIALLYHLKPGETTGTIVGRATSPTTPKETYATVSITPVIVPVEEGDKLYVRGFKSLINGIASVGEGARSYITVESIE